MHTKLEDKLASLIHEIKEIEKELILQKMGKATVVEQKIKRWETLGRKVSAKWDGCGYSLS